MMVSHYRNSPIMSLVFHSKNESMTSASWHRYKDDFRKGFEFDHRKTENWVVVRKPNPEFLQKNILPYTVSPLDFLVFFHLSVS